MKAWYYGIISILVIGTSFTAVCNAYINNQDPEMNILYPATPLKQFNTGIDANKVTCKQGFQLIIKNTNGHPACVSQETASKLIERHWGVIPLRGLPTNQSQTQIANPASVYCIQHGGQSVIKTDTNGSQYGVCQFSNGSVCDEWKYFRGECSPTP